MSTFAKKVTSAVAGLAIVFSIVSPLAGVSAAYTSVEAANKLSTLGVIVDQSANPTEYRLGDNLLRREGVKVMMNISSIAVVDNCEGKFNDLSATDWACKYAETALANGLVAANPSFSPDRLLSKIEALKMVFQGRDLEREENADFRVGYVNSAVNMGIATEAFTDYDTAVTRGQLFVWAANAIDADEEVVVEDDLLCAILGTCEDDTTVDPVDPTEPTTPTTPTVNGELEITLSPMTPAAATIPGGVAGLRVVAYDVTAGADDVTINQVSIRRSGLSDQYTIEQIAIFTDAGRVSNARSDNQDNDTTAQINLSNGGLVVMAGETVTMYAVVDVVSVVRAANDQFFLTLVDVKSNSTDLELTGNLTSNKFTVGSIDAPLITIKNGGSVSNPNLGEDNADIFEFEIEGASDEDIILQSITFEADGDAEDDLMNFELLMGGKVIATQEMMSGDYLTFNIDGGLRIQEDKNEDFIVRADVVDGAADVIRFRIDERLDVRADSTKFGFGATSNITAVDTFGELNEITIQAGELTFVEIDADFDEVREDKDNVVLGSIRVTNLSSQALELADFGVDISLDNGGLSALGATATGTLTVTELLTDVELFNEETGSSYTLDANPTEAVLSGNDSTALYSDNNIDAVIPAGVSTWSIRADTAKDIRNFDASSIDMSVDVVANVRVNETADDERVTDITPSTLSFNSIDGSESGAKISAIPLSDTTVVRGATDVRVLEFELEAEEVSAITVDQLTVQVTGTGTSAVSRQEVSNVKLYKGSEATGNLLDSESQIGTNGAVTFRSFTGWDVMIAANATQKFVVTVSFVDSVDAVNKSNYLTSLTSISIEDDENDDVIVSNLPLNSGRDVAVTNAGTIQTLAFDPANADNEFDKLALAGNSKVIVSYDVRADNEAVEVQEVTFDISNATADLNKSVVNATLLLDGVAIATNRNSEITQNEIRFTDVANLVIPRTTSELALQLNTATIGEDFVGKEQNNLTVTRVTLADLEGQQSGKTISDVSSAVTNSRQLSIVRAVVTPAVVSTFSTNDQTSELRLVVEGGMNTSDNGNAVQAELTQLKIEVSSVTGTGWDLVVFNGNGTQVGTVAIATAWTYTVAIDDPNVSTPNGDSIGTNNEVYRLETTVNATYRLAKDGVTYSVNGNGSTSTKLQTTLLLGQYVRNN